jgi:hypothetical protein
LTAITLAVKYSLMTRAQASTDAADLLKNSTLYREFLAEREEILRHKWIESEKQGRDIGFEKALLDWMLKHRTTWRQFRAASKVP